jgi:hypothetical protein
MPTHGTEPRAQPGLFEKGFSGRQARSRPAIASEAESLCGAPAVPWRTMIWPAPAIHIADLLAPQLHRTSDLNAAQVFLLNFGAFAKTVGP